MGKKLIPLLAALVLLLTGCAMPTVDQLYCLPKRPDSYNDMQSVFDEAMEGMEYSAPRNGGNIQTVQMADLDGDGVREYLLFARYDGEKPLRILIFAQQPDERYALTETIACNGAYFDQITYAQLDDSGGQELLVGCRISEQVNRSLSVYSYGEGAAQMILSTSYINYLTCDLDSNGQNELMVLKPGITGGDAGAASLFRMEGGEGTRSNEVLLSFPVDKLSRSFTGKLQNGGQAMFLVGCPNEGVLRTDVLTVSEGQLINVSQLSQTDTRSDVLGENFIYPEDIDGDGIVELPQQRTVRSPDGTQEFSLIRWYSLDPEGAETDKLHTYHDYYGGWYLHLDPDWVESLRISREGNAVAFYMPGSDGSQLQKMFSIYALTGQDRESQAVLENRFTVYRDQSITYAARLEVASGALDIHQSHLISSFRLIHQAWKSGDN